MNLQKPIMSIDKMGLWYLFRCNPSIQLISFNAKASFIVVLKEVIGKTTFFLNFCQKMRKLSLNIANKHYVRPPQSYKQKTNIIFGSSSLTQNVLGGKRLEKYTEALQKYQFSTPTPQDLTICVAYNIGLDLTNFQIQGGGGKEWQN